MSRWDDRQERDALYLKALEKWGEDERVAKAVEECAEFAAAMTRVLHEPVGHDSVQNMKDMLGEMADVMIMLEQLELIFDEFGEMMKEMRDAKLDRLEGFLKIDEARE